MVDVILLGTGTPMVDAARCGSGTAIVDAAGWLLVDCGRGVPQRIAEAGLDMSLLRAVFLTHHHSDHISDLATLATMRWCDGAPDPLIVVAPQGPCARFAATCLDPFDQTAFHGQASPAAGAHPRIAVQAFSAQPSPESVYEDDRFVVSSALVDHHPIEAAVGYRIIVSGSVVTLSGDTAVCSGVEELADGADLLIHEAVRASAASPKLLAWNASAESVGALAKRANVRHVVLTHLLPPPQSADDEAGFVVDARRGGFVGPITVARDHLRIGGLEDQGGTDRT
jgi:ribonuclease Z